MINEFLSTMRVIALPLKTKFRGITVREVALFESEFGLVEFSPFLEYDDHESSHWLACTLEAASGKSFPLHRKQILFNGTIPEVNDRDILNQLLHDFSEVNTFKFKVGSNIADDISRVEYAKNARPDIKVRIDVNGLWSVDEAAIYLNSMQSAIGEIEYVEQPCATIEELRALKEKTSVLIAADEIIRKAQDPFAIDISDAADILVLKVQPLGGIERSLAIAAHHQKPVVVSSALESSTGLAYGVKLAQALPELQFDCGLATDNLFATAGTDVSADRYEWWKNRVMRCAELLGSK